MPYIIGFVALIALGSFSVDKVGEGINEASTGLLKIALGGGLIYVIGKKLKWL